MEHLPADEVIGAVVRATVESIPQQRMAGLGEMNPYLVGSTGQQIHLDQGGIRELFQDSISGYRLTTAAVDGSNPVAVSAASQKRHELSGRELHTPRNQGQISLANSTPGKSRGKAFMRSWVNGKDHDPRGFAIEPLHHAQGGALLRPERVMKIVQKRRIQGAAVASGCRLGLHPCRLVDGQQKPVTANDMGVAEHEWIKRQAVQVDFHHVPGMNRQRASADPSACQMNPSEIHDLSHERTGEFGDSPGHEKIEPHTCLFVRRDNSEVATVTTCHSDPPLDDECGWHA